MDKLLNFLLDYYLWILGVLVIIIITIIGFLVDSKQKRKKKESSINATDVGEVKTVTEVDTPKEDVVLDTNNVVQESINNVSDNVNTNSEGVNKVIENSTSSKNLDLLSNQTPHFEPREVNIPNVNKNMEVNNGLNAVTNANTSNATIVQAHQSINPISSNNVNANGMYYNNASMPVQEVKNYNEPEVINSTSNYGQNVYQGVNMVPNNNMIYTNNATLREVVPQPVQAVPINNAYNGQMGFQNNRVNNQMYTNYNSNANYTTPIPNNTNVNYTTPIGEVPNNNYAKVIPNTVNNNNVSNNMNNNVNNSQVSAYPNMSFVTGDKNDDTWKL